MNDISIFKKYYTKLDKIDERNIDNKVAEVGIDEYLNQQLIYLDCSRIIQGMRMIQTIGFPYKYEISKYFYALHNYIFIEEDRAIWYEKIIKLHDANLEYEKENPPIWYDDKTKKTTKRKHKVKEGDIFPEENKPSKAEAKLKAKLLGASVGFGSFKLIKPNNN